MSAVAVTPTIDVDTFLAGAQFSDAFSIFVPTTALTARIAAERMFGRSPRWVTFLLRLRDTLVTPFGLTTTRSARHASVDKIGFFPILSETPQRLIAGLNDGHLDFRVVVDVVDTAGGQRVTATTIVLMHNWLGRVYLAIIKPVHRIVARAMLEQVVDDDRAA